MSHSWILGRTPRARRSVLVAVTAALSLAGCAAGPQPPAKTLPQAVPSTETASAATSAATTPSASSVPSATVVALPAGLVGPGCAGFVGQLADGSASVRTMAGQPLLPAMAMSPDLSQAVSALSGGLNGRVDLTATLDGGRFTVFAPVNSAFAQIPSTLYRFKTDPAYFTRVLRYHVLAGRTDGPLLPGRHRTLSGAGLTVAGSGDRLTVDGRHVLCGGIRTSSSVLYLLDGWLQPS